MSASERPAPATGTGLSEDSAAAKPLELFDVDSSPATDISISTQLRRRRQASLRCEPLHDGRRDPWPEGVRGPGRPEASTPRALRVEVGRRTAWLFGDKVFALLDTVRIEQRQWDWERRVWMIPMQYADDVMAFAEWKQRRVVTCEAVDR